MVPSWSTVSNKSTMCSINQCFIQLNSTQRWEGGCWNKYRNLTFMHHPTNVFESTLSTPSWWHLNAVSLGLDLIPAKQHERKQSLNHFTDILIWNSAGSESSYHVIEPESLETFYTWQILLICSFQFVPLSPMFSPVRQWVRPALFSTCHFPLHILSVHFRNLLQFVTARALFCIFTWKRKDESKLSQME